MIVGKSRIIKEQLNSKQQYGINNIEIQLYGDDFNRDIKDLFEEITSCNVNIVNVHSPLNVIERTDLNLEYLTNDFLSEVFIKTCRLSQELADYYNHDINIIIHNSLTLNTLLLMPALLEEIKKILDYVLDVFPNITFSIENVLPFYFGKNIECFGGFLFDNVELAEYFNNCCVRPAFYTTLDICHVLYTLKFVDLFKNEKFYKSYTLRDFLLKNKNTINNFHLSNLTNWGYDKLEHGSVLKIENEVDKKVLTEFFNFLKEFNLDATITLEVVEEDYTICKNFKEMLDVVNYFLNKKEL